MTFRLLLAILLLLSLPQWARAQSASWCAPGASWQYSYAEMFGQGTMQMRYAADSVVGGRAAQVLRRTVTVAMALAPGVYMPASTSATSPIITRTAGDSVLFWHAPTRRYVPLYCFGARPGESWTTYASFAYGVCSQYPVVVTVDSVGTTLLGGRPVRWQAVKVSGDHTFWGRRIYEGIGNVQSFQAGGAACGLNMGSILGLRSFQALGQPAIGPGKGGQLVLGTVAAQAQRAGFAAYPTPTTGLLTVQLPAALPAGSCLALHDLAGRLVRQLGPASAQLDLAGLPAGLYVLTLSGPGQAPLSQRVALHH